LHQFAGPKGEGRQPFAAVIFPAPIGAAPLSIKSIIGSVKIGKPNMTPN
jgi:hypothetical protein